MKVFHHDDNDGKAAAAIVGYLQRKLDKPAPQYIPMHYSTPFPLATIETGEEVWIVDYSIQPAEMNALQVVTKNVHWIDHHKSAIEKYADYPNAPKGIRRDGTAACMLAWEYTWSLYTESEGVDCDPPPAPFGIKLIADRDVWRFEYGNRTRQYHEGTLTYDTDPASVFWERCLEDLHSYHVLEVEERGVPVLLYKNRQAAENLKKLSYEVFFQGHTCLAMNMQERSSEGFGLDSEALLVKYPMLIAYTHSREGFQVSLYSKKLDVAEIAEYFGGGGHRGAVGFTALHPPWGTRVV